MPAYELNWNVPGTGGEEFNSHICQATLTTLSRKRWGIYDIAYFKTPSSPSITYDIEEMFGELAEKGISVPDPKAIRDYLTTHSDVTEFISRVSQHVWSQLGAHSYLSLELYIDYEIDDQYPTLYVRQDTYDENILDTIDQVFEPFMDKLADVNGWFLVTTDFGHPGRER